MFIPIHWTSPQKIPNLELLLRNCREQSGRLVEYRRVWSLLVFSSMSPRIECVAPRTSRVLAGLKHTIFSMLLGWWSWTGVFWTIAVILGNTMGGIDVTDVLSAPPGHPIPSAALAELQRARRVQAVAFAVGLLLILAIAVKYLVLPYLGELKRVL